MEFCDWSIRAIQRAVALILQDVLVTRLVQLHQGLIHVPVNIYLFCALGKEPL